MLNLPQTNKWDIARVSHSTLVNADCFDVFPFIEDKSIDAIICDLPYGTTSCKWDSVIPFEPLWEQYKRIIKDNGVIALTGSQPFTSALVMSNPKMFKHEWIWRKNRVTGIYNVKTDPLKAHENILIFANNRNYTFNRQLEERSKNSHTHKSKKYSGTGIYDGCDNSYKEIKKGDLSNPKSVQNINCLHYTDKAEHPTQKPVALMEYLIKTYTNEGDMVLDNTMGSGTTNLACLKLNRKSIGIEKEKQYYDVAVRRLSSYCG